MVDVAGVPPGKLQAYVKVLEAGAHPCTTAVGEIVAVPHEFGIVFMMAVGGFFTVMI